LSLLQGTIKHRSKLFMFYIQLVTRFLGTLNMKNKRKKTPIEILCQTKNPASRTSARFTLNIAANCYRAKTNPETTLKQFAAHRPPPGTKHHVEQHDTPISSATVTAKPT
jgi:hypothetical protein